MKAEPTKSVVKGHRRKGENKLKLNEMPSLVWEGGFLVRQNSENGGMQSPSMQETRKTLSKEGMGICNQWALIVIKL